VLVEIGIKKIIMTPSTCAVFLGNDEKVFVLYVGPGVGAAISMTLEGIKKVRPLTHDLISSILAGLGIRVERIVINDLRGNTFYARLFLREDGERGTRIVEIDARPSDCVVLATQNTAPIYVDASVMEKVEDVSHLVGGEGDLDEA
jgi:bifunctional DNase/RNase